MISDDSAPVAATVVFEQQARMMKVLAHPARLAILEILRGGEQCVCHMEAYLGLRQAYISQQLMVLREASIIQDRRDGWNVFYRVSEPAIFDVLEVIGTLAGPIESELPPRPAVVCTCPKCSARLPGCEE